MSIDPVSNPLYNLDKTQYKDFGYGVTAEGGKLQLLPCARRSVREHDVKIEVLYSGICHSDIHKVDNGWMNSNYPMIPGHEFVGRVVQIGSAVTKIKVGDMAGIGVIVSSCSNCDHCKKGFEQYCAEKVETYDTPDPHEKSIRTMGGYSLTYVSDDHFVYKLPEGMDYAAAAPLFCAGITAYSPLKYNNVGPGKKVGIVGFGGVGHMAVKMAVAMGADVVVFTTSPDKKPDLQKYNISKIVLSTDQNQMDEAKETLDVILDFASMKHNITPAMETLKYGGTYCMIGMPDGPLEISTFALQLQNRKLTGSFIGSVKDTEEMVKFCAEHKISPDVEMTTLEEVNEAFTRVKNNDVKYRFVIDMTKSKLKTQGVGSSTGVQLEMN